MKKRTWLLPALLVLVPALALWAGGATEKPGPAAKAAGQGLNFIANVPLTMWCDISERTLATRQNHGDIPAYQEVEKLTGVKMKWIHPPLGQQNEQFNLIIASGDYPDIIYWNWCRRFPGGPDKAVDDKVIIKLNDMMKASAPNLSKWLNSRPDIAKQVVTDKGTMYEVPFQRPDINSPDETWQRFSTSAQLRQDWLTKLGLAVPETMADWEKVLTAFKTIAPNVYPLSSQDNAAAEKSIWGLRWFMSGWGMNYDWYQINGEIHYGSAEPKYREYLETMNRWYKNGLIDPDFLTRTNTTLRPLVVEGRVGAYWGLVNRDMGSFIPLGQKNNPNFKIVLAPWPKAADGKAYALSDDGPNVFPGDGAAISTKCKNPAEALKWLDFYYSDTGHILANFGIEGLSFNWVNGFPKYSDLITKNPDKLPMVTALNKYAPDGGSGRFWRQDARYFEQVLALPEQLAGGKMMAKTSDISRAVPPVTPTPDESRQIARILNEVNTYRDEAFVKFVTGVQPLSQFDEYLSWMQTKLKPAIDIMTAAMKRYEVRAVPKF